jgi:hypothetical protein
MISVDGGFKGRKVEGLVDWTRLHGGKRSDEVLKGLPNNFSATAGSVLPRGHTTTCWYFGKLG